MLRKTQRTIKDISKSNQHGLNQQKYFKTVLDIDKHSLKAVIGSGAKKKNI